MSTRSYPSKLPRFKMGDEVVLLSTGERAVVCETFDSPYVYVVEYDDDDDRDVDFVRADNLRPYHEEQPQAA